MRAPRLLACLAPLCAALAQAPAFDAATVKPSPPAAGDRIDINLGTARHGLVTLGNATLSECIQWAYALAGREQVEGPVWIDDRAIRFDIVAKAAPDTADARLRQMMQTLLAERFDLQMHPAPRRIDHYEIAVARDGPKLEPSAKDTPAVTRVYANGHLSYSRLTMRALAIQLTWRLKMPVLDKTGLAGFFDVDLQWTPDDPNPSADGGAPLYPDIFAAMRRELGLTLERKKTPVDVYVVDRAEKTPAGN